MKSALFFFSILGLSSFAIAQEQTVPLAGNSWVSQQKGDEKVGNNGWANWTSSDAIFSTYVFLRNPGSITIASTIQLPSGSSRIRCTIGGKSTETTIQEGEKRYELGTFSVADTGYLRIDIQGISRTGAEFARMQTLLISGSAVNNQTAYVKNNEGNYFYWGRRGPSVHLGYDLSGLAEDAEYFYNEIIVPKGNDVIGSYFMANGFAEGYFGMQVNSEKERRILFSVWSPFVTDDPKQIPPDQKILMLKKGKEVYTGEFGNEGAGGQSYLKYYWNAGDTCRFLLRAKPSENNYTDYTAWFFDGTQNRWRLIASFSRPATKTYLKRLHSFLENFIPNTGNQSRKAYYQNQWVRTVSGEWKPLEKARFTGDATAQKEYRLDYKGGVENGAFFLENCGFFSDRQPLRTNLIGKQSVRRPVIDLGLLE